MDGKYRFSFSAATGFEKYALNAEVLVYLNGVYKFSIVDSNNEGWSDGNSLSYNWIWSMTEGENVTFIVYNGNNGRNALASAKASLEFRFMLQAINQNNRFDFPNNQNNPFDFRNNQNYLNELAGLSQQFIQDGIQDGESYLRADSTVPIIFTGELVYDEQ